jgi:hypothetical protein
VVIALNSDITASAYVPEWQDEFLALFPHRYDYIWAEHTPLGVPVPWQTEKRHPLSDRHIRQGSNLYGVRFGSETGYALLDIDAGSAYHPSRDAFAIPSIVQALELLGLASYIGITSSASGGLHLYFPFDQPCSSWQIAVVLTTTLEAAGFKVYPGQLEVFPNPKPYSPDGNPTLFNAHRLPLQQGSYLLNSEFQPIWTTEQHFIEQWQFCQSRNRLNIDTLKQILKQSKRLQQPVTGKANKFINDLNVEIELGWTGPGQTNRLLGRITLREYVFRHVLSGGEPLTGQLLVDAVVDVARSLPGYTQWCRHQSEIVQRAEEWASCIANSHYFPYGSAQGKFQAKQPSNLALDNPSDRVNADLEAATQHLPTWNQQRSESARDRIRHALIDLLETDRLPAKTTARFQALLQYGIGGGSLYRHRDLWHPQFLLELPPLERPSQELPQELPNPSLNMVSPKPPGNPPVYFSSQNSQADFHPEDERCDCVAASHRSSPTSLFPSDVGNTFSSRTSGDLDSQDSDRRVGNLSLSCVAVDIAADASQGLSTLLIGVQQVHAALANLQTWKDRQQAVVQLSQQQQHAQRQQAAETKRRSQMQQFLASGDPILMAEALAWAEANGQGLRH